MRKQLFAHDCQWKMAVCEGGEEQSWPVDRYEMRAYYGKKVNLLDLDEYDVPVSDESQ